jgi:uncharacterized protein DUF6510
MTPHLDGNAIAGLFEEVFGVEVTATMRTCQTCGHENAIGAHRLYRGAGLVLRCPHCYDLAAVIVGRRIERFGVWGEELV